MNDLLLGLIRGYNSLTIEETNEKHHDSQWFKIAKDIEKKLLKFVPKNINQRLIINNFNKIKELDADYFNDKDFSAFVMSILLLDYLKLEQRDTTSRSKFGHINTSAIIHELETTKEFQHITRSHHRFTTKIIETLGL